MSALISSRLVGLMGWTGVCRVSDTPDETLLDMCDIRNHILGFLIQHLCVTQHHTAANLLIQMSEDIV